jgi:hypothetical protein
MLKSKDLFKYVLILAAGSVLTPAVHADSLALNFSDPGSYFTSDTPISIGWQFQVLHPITVTALGDLWLSTFTETHDVGIFSVSDSSLITSATVTASDPQTSFFRFASITPIVLNPGTYRIAATTVSDPWGFIPSGQTTNSAVVYQNGFFTYGDGLQYPTGSEAPTSSYFGPDFLMTADSSISTPEASAWTLTIAGLGLLLGGSAFRLRGTRK